MKQYGVFIGRMQPLHSGHQQIIDQIIADGLEPLIILGSAQEFCTEKNPYHHEARKFMIQLVYPNVIVKTLNDFDCWTTWHTELLQVLEKVTPLSNCTIYTHAKDEDRQDFEFRGVEYTNEFYSKVFEVDGMHVKKIITANHSIRATSIRKDLEANKQHLHPLVYKFLKEQ